MMIVYVLPHANLCGGVKVIAEHVTGLCSRGHTAEVWGLTGDFGWFPRHVPHRIFPSTGDLGEALRATRAAKVATFWITASWIPPNLMEGERGFYLVQDEIERKHGVKCHNGGIGIDHTVFRPLPFIRERKRVLTPARTTSAGPAGLKGWDVAIESLRIVAARDPEASLVTFGVEDVMPVGFMPHVHLQCPSDRKLRELYSQSGVFLSCSRHEGFGLPQLEAMACGCPTVCTDAHGNREYARNGETSLMSGHDPERLAENMIRVMHEPELAARLSAAGIGEASRYRWGPVIERLEGILAAG